MSDFKFYPGTDEGSRREHSFHPEPEQSRKVTASDKKEKKAGKESSANAEKTVNKTAVLNNTLNHRISMCCVVFGYEEDELKILLPESDSGLTLPGCVASNNQTLEASARQIVHELSGAEKFFIEQVYSFGNPPGLNKRTDEGENDSGAAPAWEITVAFFALLNADSATANTAFSLQRAKWYPLKKTKALTPEQQRIVEKSLATLRFEIRYFPIAFELLPEKFTLAQVQSLYEAISGKKLDKRNFRKKVKALNLIMPSGEKQRNNIARPSELFVFNRDAFSDSHNSIL